MVDSGSERLQARLKLIFSVDSVDKENIIVCLKKEKRSMVPHLEKENWRFFRIFKWRFGVILYIKKRERIGLIQWKEKKNFRLLKNEDN